MVALQGTYHHRHHFNRKAAESSAVRLLPWQRCVFFFFFLRGDSLWNTIDKPNSAQVAAFAQVNTPVWWLPRTRKVPSQSSPPKSNHQHHRLVCQVLHFRSIDSCSGQSFSVCLLSSLWHVIAYSGTLSSLLRSIPLYEQNMIVFLFYSWERVYQPGLFMNSANMNILVCAFWWT